MVAQYRVATALQSLPEQPKPSVDAIGDMALFEATIHKSINDSTGSFNLKLIESN